MLTLEALTVEFGGLRALDSVDLAVAPGEAVALAGPNGSGKTTLFNAITGVVRASTGDVRLAGRTITGLPPHAIARLGVARALQHPRPYGRMTVAENLHAAWTAVPRGWRDLAGLDPSVARERREAVERTIDLLDLVGQADVPAAALSLAERRRLNLAQAIVRDPTLLLLDEPTGGLSVAETESMAMLLAVRVLPGRTVVIVDHDLALLARLCRRLVVLEAGRKRADGPAASVLDDPAIRQCLMGPPAAGTADA
jgi:ABC-type branched-subunit amino acid transport system ATPase component